MRNRAVVHILPSLEISPPAPQQSGLVMRSFFLVTRRVVVTRGALTSSSVLKHGVLGGCLGDFAT